MILTNGKFRLIALTGIAAVALTLAAVACGGGDDDDGGDGAGTATGGAGQTTFDVAMNEAAGNLFVLDGEKNPTLKVAAGKEITVNLTNEGVAIHNMRFAGEDNEFNSADDATSDPGLVNAGQKAKVTFTAPGKAGKYKYQCDFHPTDMKGEIEVQ